MEQGDWQNDADYPRAPLPAHERTWRHPSEVGADQWVRSEPPLVVGRGLSVATGTVGAVLAIGLLWLMVPHPNGGSGVAVEASTTATRATVSATAAPVPRDSSTTAVGIDESTVAPTTTEVIEPAPTTIDASLSASTSPALTIAPMPTMLLDSGTTVTETPPIAVALMPGHYVVTTAAAVRGREGFAVMLPSGDTVVGAVVSVDVVNGTAVLSVGTAVDADLIPPSTADITSGRFVVMAPEATEASVWVDDAGAQIDYVHRLGASAGEGSVVLDDDGRLVGMCTRSAQGMQLITVASLLDALIAAAAMQTPAWMGVDYGLDEAGNVVVTRVLGDGPGLAAGLRIGDVITAVDGVAVDDPEALRAAIGTRVAGDSVTLTVSQSAPAQTTTTAVATTSTVTVGSSTPGTNSSTSIASSTSVASNATTTTPATSSAPAAVAVDIVVTLAPAPGNS